MIKMRAFFLRIIILLAPVFAWGNPVFDNYFTSGVMRFDYLLSGNHDTAYVFPVQMKKENLWGGSQSNMIDPHDYGTYRFQVFDKSGGELIFLKGFCPLFQEWQSTGEAKKISRSFYQVLRFPFPKQSVRLEIDRRGRDGRFRMVYSTVIDPTSHFIINEKPEPVSIGNILVSGEPAHKIDIAILAEGYKAAEMNKFLKDAKTLTDSLFRSEPFSQMKNYFNIYALKTPSVESGTDVPGEGIFRNTIFNSTFYTFDISRYLTTSDMKSVCDKAAGVPYDHIIVLVNSERYGGGGFYNYLNVCTAGNKLSPKTFVHEFGHSFAGLGDEYYTSEVAYEDYYNLKIEPWEPNLTTLVDFASKWKSMVDSITPIPTPRYSGYESKVGAFEGGGYEAKGIYSPMEDCRMKSNATSHFCPVCVKAIKDIILLNTK
jgi:hypothetical protein